MVDLKPFSFSILDEELVNEDEFNNSFPKLNGLLIEEGLKLDIVSCILLIFPKFD